MTWIYFWINGVEVLPVRFGVFSYLFAWPAVLALARFDLSLRFRVLAMTGYFLIPLLFPLTYFEFISVWGTCMGIPSLLLLFFALPRFRVVGSIVFIVIFFAAWGALTGIFTFAQAYLALGLELGTEVPVRIPITATGRRTFCVTRTAGGKFWWICWTTVMR